MNLQPHIKRTLLQALLIGAGIFLSVMANAQFDTSFKGRVIMPDGGKEEITMMLSDSATVQQIGLAGDGSFEFKVALQGCVVLSVSAPDHLPRIINIGSDLSEPAEPIEYDIMLVPLAALSRYEQTKERE